MAAVICTGTASAAFACATPRPPSLGKLPSLHVSAALQGNAASLLALHCTANGDVAIAVAESDTSAAAGGNGTSGSVLATAGGLCLKISAVVGDNGQQRLLKDLVDALHLLAAALHVLGAHLLGNGEALLGSHGRQTLRLEHVDARLLEAQIGLEADEDQRRVGAEMQDLGVPLFC